jgi:hypothetical protein
MLERVTEENHVILPADFRECLTFDPNSEAVAHVTVHERIHSACVITQIPQIADQPSRSTADIKKAHALLQFYPAYHVQIGPSPPIYQERERR